MVKKLSNLKWETVALEGFPTEMTKDLHGFVGLEECVDYGTEKHKKGNKKSNVEHTKLLRKTSNGELKPAPVRWTLDFCEKKQQKRKTTELEKEVPNKKLKIDNGFVVEPCDNATPSLTNNKEINASEQIKYKIKEPVKNSPKPVKKVRTKLGETTNKVDVVLTPEDMLTWAEFKLPEEIIKALAELGFKKPTKIQQLTLPAAIHGRRDILGAAETGSGKTLAFGLPILSGIMELKEKAAAGLDVYSLPYKKSSAKRKPKDTETANKHIGRKKKRNIKGKNNLPPKESSDDDSVDENEETNDETVEVNIEKNEEDDFIEEIDIPLKKKVSEDDENTSEDGDNFVHLSEMLDSDDLADSTDDEQESASVANEVDADLNDTDENNDNSAIGCVKVIDNIEIPGHVVTKTGKPLYALIITPTRELALQISRHLIAVAKYTGIRIETIVGGMAAVKQERVLRSGPEVVVATPGRLWELLAQGQPHLQQLDSVKFLAIDETDRMLERNHFEELVPLLERLNADDDQRNTRQNFVFSATLTLVHDLPAHMKGKKVTKRGKIINRKVINMSPQQKIKRLINYIGMTDPKVVDITTQNLGTAETLTECKIACAKEHKDAYLYYILKRHPGRTIVFCNSIGSVKRLTQVLLLLKFRPLPLHADIQQRHRLKNLERFRDDPQGVLVASDVAARGLDIPDVDHVIHYQVPRTAENYIHRSGRTARADKEGLTILMMEPAEAFLYNKLSRTLNKTIELPTFPVCPMSLSSLKETLKLCHEVDALALAARRGAQARGWRDRAARELDIIIDEDDFPTVEVDPSLDKALQIKKKKLDAMLSKPIFPKGFSFKYPTLNDPGALELPDQNALQVMKNAMVSVTAKKEKRKGKNEELLKLKNIFKKK